MFVSTPSLTELILVTILLLVLIIPVILSLLKMFFDDLKHQIKYDEGKKLYNNAYKYNNMVGWLKYLQHSESKYKPIRYEKEYIRYLLFMDSDGIIKVEKSPMLKNGQIIESGCELFKLSPNEIKEEIKNVINYYNDKKLKKYIEDTKDMVLKKETDNFFKEVL